MVIFLKLFINYDNYELRNWYGIKFEVLYILEVLYMFFFKGVNWLKIVIKMDIVFN